MQNEIAYMYLVMLASFIFSYISFIIIIKHTYIQRSWYSLVNISYSNYDRCRKLPIWFPKMYWKFQDTLTVIWTREVQHRRYCWNTSVGNKYNPYVTSIICTVLLSYLHEMWDFFENMKEFTDKNVKFLNLQARENTLQDSQMTNDAIFRIKICMIDTVSN